MSIPEPYPDLFAAAAAWFNQDATMQATFPGGVVARPTVDQRFPYARVSWRKPQPGLSLEDEPYLITLAAYALSDDAAANAGEQLLKSYLDETRPPLVFTDLRGNTWREGRRLEQEAQGPEQVDILAATDEGSDEGYVWRYRVPIEVWVVKQ